jgi:hypothetical protein
LVTCANKKGYKIMNDNPLSVELGLLIKGYGWREFLEALKQNMYGRGGPIAGLRVDIKNTLYLLEREEAEKKDG